MVAYIINMSVMLLFLLFLIVVGAIGLIFPETFDVIGQYFVPAKYISVFGEDIHFETLAPLYNEMQSMFFLSLAGIFLTGIVVLLKPHIESKFLSCYAFRGLFIVNFIIYLAYMVYAGFKFNDLYEAFLSYYPNANNFMGAFHKFNGVYFWFFHPTFVHANLMVMIYGLGANLDEPNSNSILGTFVCAFQILLYPILLGLLSAGEWFDNILLVLFDIIAIICNVGYYICTFVFFAEPYEYFMDNFWEE